MLFILKKDCLLVRDDLVTAWNVLKNLEKPQGFDDVMGKDNDRDWVSGFDDDDCTKSFFMDEPGTQMMSCGVTGRFSSPDGKKHNTEKSHHFPMPDRTLQCGEMQIEIGNSESHRDNKMACKMNTC